MPIRDTYANIFTFAVTQSAANTLTFAELQTNLGIQPVRGSIVAMIVDSIEYDLTNGFAELAGDTDVVQAALTISNQVTDLTDMTDRRILHLSSIKRVDAGTAASSTHYVGPTRFDFNPPMIHAEKSMYLAVDSTSLANPCTIRCRGYYRLVTLTDAELIELTEVFRLVG
jgi:hypothetical protein